MMRKCMGTYLGVSDMEVSWIISIFFFFATSRPLQEHYCTIGKNKGLHIIINACNNIRICNLDLLLKIITMIILHI